MWFSDPDGTKPSILFGGSWRHMISLVHMILLHVEDLIAITMATEASSSDVHMATAAVGTEGGGGGGCKTSREMGGGGFWTLTHLVAA